MNMKMMSRYEKNNIRKVNAGIWMENDVRGMSEREKLFFLYILTSKNMSRFGLAFLSVYFFPMVMHCTLEESKEALMSLESLGLIKCDWKNDTIFVVRYMEYDPSLFSDGFTEEMKEEIIGVLRGMPATMLVSDFMDAFVSYGREYGLSEEDISSFNSFMVGLPFASDGIRIGSEKECDEMEEEEGEGEGEGDVEVHSTFYIKDSSVQEHDGEQDDRLVGFSFGQDKKASSLESSSKSCSDSVVGMEQEEIPVSSNSMLSMVDGDDSMEIQVSSSFPEEILSSASEQEKEADESNGANVANVSSVSDILDVSSGSVEIEIDNDDESVHSASESDSEGKNENENIETEKTVEASETLSTSVMEKESSKEDKVEDSLEKEEDPPKKKRGRKKKSENEKDDSKKDSNDEEKVKKQGRCKKKEKDDNEDEVETKTVAGKKRGGRKKDPTEGMLPEEIAIYKARKEKQDRIYLEMWEGYPNKDFPSRTRDIFDKLIKSGEFKAEDILEATKNYLYEMEKKGTDEKFHFALRNFLHERYFVEFLPENYNTGTPREEREDDEFYHGEDLLAIVEGNSDKKDEVKLEEEKESKSENNDVEESANLPEVKDLGKVENNETPSKDADIQKNDSKDDEKSSHSDRDTHPIHLSRIEKAQEANKKTNDSDERFGLVPMENMDGEEYPIGEDSIGFEHTGILDGNLNPVEHSLPSDKASKSFLWGSEPKEDDGLDDIIPDSVDSTIPATTPVNNPHLLR